MSSSADGQRILYVDPNNLEGNELTNIPNNTEDLSIFVELTTTKRPRGIIKDGSYNQIDGSNGRINFIEGSQLSGDKCDRSLTTNYTDINTTFKSDDSFEGFGMESIDITFDTAYTPLVKIKFIDVRGGVMSRGNDSKYNIFFNLPYPIFNLTVKGYYGQAVSYCLHLVKWNGKFNSQTGNFEIDAEFIGYTFAMLTDLLMGYMRAIPYTDIGQNVFNQVKGEYDKLLGGNRIITIDEMLYVIGKLIGQLPKIQNESTEFNQIKEIDKNNKIIREIKDIHNNFLLELDKIGANANNNIVQGNDTYSLVYSKNDQILKNRNNDIEDKLKELTGDKSIIEQSYNKIIQTEKLDYNEFVNIGLNTYTYLSGKTTPNKYVTNEPRIGEICKLIQKSKRANDLKRNGFYLYDYIRFNESINTYLTNSERIRQQAITDFSKKVRDVLKTDYNFDPTIKNIFAILIASAETYLRTINTVSIIAEDQSNTLRYGQLNSIINNLNIKNNSDIFAFPTYYEDATETWLGSKVTDDVTEVKFTRDLLKSLVDSKRREKELNALLDNINGWFCLSTIDTPVLPYQTKFVQNPYSTLIGANEQPESVMRLLMYRMFTYLAFSTNSEILENDVIEFMAKFEASNMFNGITKKETRDAINEEFNNSNKIIEHFKKGSDKIKNYNGARKAIPYMFESSENYYYSYITGSGYDSASYIPITNNYDGSIFYDNNKLKTVLEISGLYNDVLFISNYVNNDTPYYTGATNGPNTEYERVYDGARYLDIISPPTYDSQTFKLPIEFIPDVIKSYEEKQKDGIEQNTISTLESKLKLQPLDGKKFNVTYFDKVKSDSANDSESLNSRSDGFSDVSQVFFVNYEGSDQYYSNTRFCIVEGDKITDDTGKNMQYYADILDNNLEDNQSVILKACEFKYYQGGANVGYSISLFGSAFYYAQNASSVDPFLSKSYLFLNTLPLRGLFGDEDGEIDTLFHFDGDDDRESSSRTIRGLFGKTSAFIKTPDLWIAWVGSVLWRYDEWLANEDPIVTKGTLTGASKNLIYDIDVFPTVFELFNNTDEGSSALEKQKAPMTFAIPSSLFRRTGYKKVDKTLLNLPKEVKDIFIEFFIDWSNNNFKKLQELLELFTPDIIPASNDNVAQLEIWEQTFALYYATAYPQYPNPNVSPGTVNLLDVAPWQVSNNTSIPQSTYNNSSFDIAIKTVQTIKPFLPNTPNILGWYKMDFEYNNEGLVSTFKDIISSHSIIANHTPNIWRRYNETNDDIREPFIVKKDIFKKYLDVFTEEYTRLYDELAEKNKNDNQVEAEIFGTTNNDFILLNIYRHLANIKDKWLGDSDSNSSMFFPCGFDTNTTLFDRFQFLNKAFTDIGDDFILNPKVISDIIIKYSNNSLFDLISNILANNNFNFIPLPAFVNFNEEGAFEKIFKPLPYVDYITNSNGLAIGPSFLCVYIGQTSTSLDIADSDYPNDGIDLYPTGHCNHRPRIDTEFDGKQQNQTNTTTSGTTRNKFANKIPVFEVNYAQQNQSYFKDINLDQREFVETQESLVVIDKISKSGDKNDAAFVGQNLFNVYQTRSYSAEIEAMGMPLIQPMMYFQLNNIPMFRGGYLIIRTEHHIKPNNMTTKFKGVRIRDVRTPLNEKVFALKELNLTETGDSDSLQYEISPIVNDSGVRNTGSAQTNINNLDIYDYNYKNYENKTKFKLSYFDEDSNTKKNGVALTYNQLFNEVGFLTGTDPNFVKNISVHESMVGQNKGVNDVNPSGFVGLMQFGKDAATDVNNSVSNLIFNKLQNLNSYTFDAELDTTNKTLKLPPSWPSNKTENSFFDDFVSAVAAVEYAKLNLGKVPSASPIDVLDGYLSHQQGRGGYKDIIANQTNLLSDGSVRASNMNNNAPFTASTVNYNTWGDWLNGWQGKIQFVYDQIVPVGQSFINSPTPNADKLRATLNSLGYRERGKQLTSAGQDINSEIEKYASAIFKKIKQLYPTYTIEVTAGNDTFHKNSSKSRHRTGDAIDFVIYVNGQKIPTPSNYKTIRDQNYSGATLPLAQQKAVTYSPQNEIAITNVKKIIQGFVVGKNPQFKFLDEYRYPSRRATGSHFHISYRENGGTEGSAFTAQAIAALNAGQITEYTV